MIAPCPATSRGIEAIVPTVPVCERNTGALEIGDAEFAVAGARHQVIERSQVLRKRQRPRAFDIRHQQAARTTLAGHIDCEAEVDLLLTTRNSSPAVFEAKEWLSEGFACTDLTIAQPMRWV